VGARTPGCGTVGHGVVLVVSLSRRLFLLAGSSSCRAREFASDCDTRGVHVEQVSLRSWDRPLRWVDRAALEASWRAFWTSRLLVLCTGVLAVLAFGRAAAWRGFDPMGLTTPSGYFGNLLAAPFARWDSVWYLTIARFGYGHQAARSAFFPLYPLLMRGLGSVIGSDLAAGVLISMAAFAVALLLLYRLAALELDAELGRLTTLLIAFCPAAYCFSAVYSESLFLALSVGCVWQARNGRWAWAGLLGGLGAAERASGLALIVPLVLLHLYGPRLDRLPTHRASDTPWARRLVPRYRPTPALAWILLVPAGLGAYLLGLTLSGGDGLAPFGAEHAWFRHFAGPFGGAWDGAVAAWDGLRQLLHGPPPPLYFPQAGGNALSVAGENLMLFAFLVLGAIALVGTLRRLPLAYGAYCLAALALPLSYPVRPQPLNSLPRYEVVLFPLFMWGAWWLRRRRLITPGIAALATLLGLFTAEFATWRFVA